MRGQLFPGLEMDPRFPLMPFRVLGEDECPETD